jgi:hypothetical protein
MAKRKTISVEDIRIKANRALSDPVVTARQDATFGEARAALYRTGIAQVLETVLFDTGNYHGFRYADHNRGLTDHTKREYYA